MPTVARPLRLLTLTIVSSALLALLLLSGSALAAKSPKPSGLPRGTLVQLPKTKGCLVDRSAPAAGCGRARALQGAGPFMGSRAVAVSPDGRNVYVAASRGNAIAIFARNPRSGALTQAAGAGGCVAAKGANGCGRAIGLSGANSVAVSPDGRNVYATARGSDAVTAFARNRVTGALHQLPGAAGCVSGLPLPGCATGRGVVGPDVVVASGDGKNVYVGSFFGNAVAAFAREAKGGGLVQLSGSTGCLAAAIAGCAPATALGAPEGMAISADGSSVYVANALANSVVALVRDPANGTLTQPAGGCIVDSPLSGCATGVQLEGANAAVVNPKGGNVYVTSLLSNSVTAFSRSSSSGALTQLPGTSACLVYLRAVGCSFGRALSAPEGLAVSPDGANVYVAAFATGAIDVLDRNPRSGAIVQRPGSAGCLAAPSVFGCSPGRALKGVSSVAVSPDGDNVYATSFGSSAIDVFKRIVPRRSNG